MPLQYRFSPRGSNEGTGARRYRVTVGDGTTYAVADEGIVKIGDFSSQYELIKFRMSLDKTERRLPGKLAPSDVIIERVVGGHDGMWSWYQAVTAGDIRRLDVKVELLAEGGRTLATLTLFQAFPYKWELPSPDTTSSANAVEKITLATEDILSEGSAGDGNNDSIPV